MPEGDTIHRLAATLKPKMAGAVITKAFSRRQGDLKRIEGELVEDVRARGKHLFIDVSRGWTLRVHLGIGGRCHTYGNDENWQRVRASAALIMETSKVVVVFFKAPQAKLMRTVHVRAEPTIRALGPDLLGEDYDIERIAKRVRSADQNMALGVALLDQKIAAGIGNVYKSEVMFIERLDPFAKLGDVEDEALRRAYERARALMLANLREGRRSTVAAEHARAGLRFYVYRRTRRPCLVCRTPIKSKRQGEQARTTYFCQRCQIAITPHSYRRAPER